MAEGVEINVSEENKEKLRCFVCERYLMCSPIRLLPDGNNICGRCSTTNKTTRAYRNVALEAVLRDALFPCRYKHQGCTKRLHFISDSDHESTCTYNTKEPELMETVANEANMKTAIKSSASTCEQEQPVASTSHETNQIPVLKAWSQCTDDSSRGNNWQDPERNASAPPSNVHNFDNMQRERAPSVASTGRTRWDTRRPSFTSGPYNNFVRNRNYQNPWGPWGTDRRPEHINMYKRRNNLIIVKGGTFYVNW